MGELKYKVNNTKHLFLLDTVATESSGDSSEGPRENEKIRQLPDYALFTCGFSSAETPDLRSDVCPSTFCHVILALPIYFVDASSVQTV